MIAPPTQNATHTITYVKVFTYYVFCCMGSAAWTNKIKFFLFSRSNCSYVIPLKYVYDYMTIYVAVRKCTDFKRATWQLTSGHYVSLDPRETKVGTSLKHCKEHCLKETSFSCKSFDRKVGDNNCYLYSKAKRDLKSNEFKASEDSNHYEWICKGIL